MREATLIMCVLALGSPTHLLGGNGSPTRNGESSGSFQDVLHGMSEKRRKGTASPKPHIKSEKYLILPSSQFTELRKSKDFVDKSLFLDEWMSRQPQHWYLTAPPGSGKSSILDMIRHFCNVTAHVVDGKITVQDSSMTSSYQYFRGTQIAGSKDFFSEHFQKYAVIYLDLAPLLATTNMQYFKHKLCTVIKKMVKTYESLVGYEGLEPSEKEFFVGYRKMGNKRCLTDFNNAMHHGSYLLQILRKVFKKEVVVLGDSFDSLWNAYMLGDINPSQRVLNYFGEFIGCFTGDELCKKPGAFNATKSFFTGVFYLASPGADRKIIAYNRPINRSLAAPENLRHSHWFDQETLAKYFALTKPEVKTILAGKSMTSLLRVVEDWYGGCPVDGSQLKLFNIRSVLTYCQSPKARPKATFSFLAGDAIDDYIMHFKKCVAFSQISFDLLACVFVGKVEVQFDKIWNHNFDDLLVMKMDKNFDYWRTPQVIEAFFEVLRGLGLVSFYRERDSQYVKPADRVSAGVLRDCFYKSGFVDQYMGEPSEMGSILINALTNFRTTENSIRTLAESVRNITAHWKKEISFDNYQDELLRALIYVYARRAVEDHGSDMIVEAGIPVHMLEGEEAKLKAAGKPVVEGEIEVLLVWPERQLAAIVAVGANYMNASSALRQMVDRRYFDVFKTDLYFSKRTIANTVLLGVALPEFELAAVEGIVLDSERNVQLNYTL